MEQKYYSFEEGGHRGGPSSHSRDQGLHPVLHCSEEGRRVASYFRSASFAQSRSNWSSACSQKQVLSQPNTSLAEYAQTWFPFSTALCEDFRQEGSPLSGGGYGLSPPLRAVEIMDMTPRGGTSCRFWFLNRGCCCGSFHFLVQRLPARPSQLPSWYNSGVPAGPFLCRVDTFHPRGLRGDHCGLSRPLWWPVSGQTPPSYTFPPRCTEAEAFGLRSSC